MKQEKQEKQKKKKKWWLIPVVLAVCVFGLFCCGEDEDYEDVENWSDETAVTTDTSAETDSDGRTTDSDSSSSSSRESVGMSLSEDGGLEISRLTRDIVTPMGAEGTWTIFVYLCGTDLETDGGMASMDMEEMEDASTGENVRFIVETGGTNSWDNEVDADVRQRYEICDGTTTLVDEQSLDNMGDSSTLADFLSWGVTNYGAAHMGVVLWNHGGGSISGVCFDETQDSDSLTLREIDAALLSVYDSMTDNFEFFGFDACLMSTVECANVLASYADYMYGSEEVEPGYGWDYEAIGNYLGSNPTADGAALGQVTVDSYYEACEEIGESSSATFAVTDLSKIDALMVAFNTYAENLYNATEDETTLTAVCRNASAADNFGGNNWSEGYANMVDLAGILDAGADYADGAEAARTALEDAVIYCKNGSSHSDACGLSVYYPLEIQGSEELTTFGQIAVSPYYLSFVDRAAYSNVNNGDTSEYDDSTAMDYWGDYEYWYSDEDGYYEDFGSYYEEYGEDGFGDYFEEYYDYYESYGDYWSYYDSYEITGESSLITFESEPALDEDGSYGFTLTPEALNVTESVQASVYMLSEDEEDIIELGISVDILMDWKTGTFYDNFDGYWFALPDGQNLAVYMVSEGDGYDIYTSPVYLNDEETNLRITHNYVTGEITIDGVWGGIDDYGMSDRELTQLSAGDEIIPIYYGYAIDSDDEYIYYGEAYTFDGEPEIYYSLLPDGEYFYGFYIDDVYGDFYTTDYVQFTVEGEDVYYYEE